MGFRRGFKADAERLAAGTRQELGLGLYDRLDPLLLAQYLDIPVWSISDLATQADAAPELATAVAVLHHEELAAVSAFTIFRDSRRVIVHNDAHSPGRQASNQCHELAHGLLLHPPSPALDRQGCRNWNADYEDEASFLGGALLIPARAAWRIAGTGTSLADAAVQYGCSEQLVRWRTNITGASKRMAS